MRSTHTHRRTAGIAAIALALGTAAGPASARTFDYNSTGSLVQQPTPSVSHATAPANGANGFDWGYVAIGSSAAGLVLVGVGGALATGRRRERRNDAKQPTIAA